MGSWSAHIDAEMDRITAALRAVGYRAVRYGFGVMAIDGSVFIEVRPKLETCDCGTYKYLPGRITVCPACGKPLPS